MTFKALIFVFCQYVYIEFKCTLKNAAKSGTITYFSKPFLQLTVKIKQPEYWQNTHLKKTTHPSEAAYIYMEIFQEMINIIIIIIIIINNTIIIMLFVSRSMDLWKITCISSLCPINKMLLPSISIFSFLL